MINQQNPKSGITKIYYFNRWGLQTPFIHMSFDYQHFTTQPMKPSKKSQDLYKISIPNCFHLQFVFCNQSKTVWNNPSIYCNPSYQSHSNYQTRKDGCYVVFDHKLIKINWKSEKSNPKNKIQLLLFTDLDKTLYGNDEQMAYFNEYWISNFFFHKDKYLLVYCTGRSAYSTHRLFEKKQLLLPDYLITSTGSFVSNFRTQKQNIDLIFGASHKQPHDPEFQDFYDKLFIDDPEWSKIKFKGKDWQRQRVVEAIEEYSNKYENWLKINTRDPADNCAIRCICNTDYFIKYGNTLQELKDRLEVMNMPGKIVVIGTGDGRYIDVFPESISKGEAAKFVISQVNIDENSRIVSFGDSNNDRELLQVTKEAYFVKNIESDAFKWYTKNKEKQENKHIKISEFEQAAALRYYLQNDL